MVEKKRTMEKKVFKTNINCSSCIAKVTDTLNDVAGEGNWKIDTANPEKPLVISDVDVPTSFVVESLEEIGFKAEPAW